MGRTSIASTTGIKKIRRRKKKKEVIDFNERIYEIEVRPKDEEDETFQGKLEELRIEVNKRAI